MLEGLAAWVLNNYLGRYVENLNTDQLSIGLLKGEVELECLPLRKDAFNLLDIPLQIVAGYVGKIRLNIPVTRIRSEPWVISIEQLYIVVGPTSLTEYDEEKEQERENTRKLGKLDLMEAGWRSDHEAKQEASYYASSYSSWVSYGASFVSSVVENLQLKVRDVHIRFEDAVTTPEKPVACGITIEGLVAQSANDTWSPQFVQKGEGEATRKLVELQNLSLYWDVSQVTLVGSLQMQELVDAMQALLSSKSDPQKSPHDYVLEPVCAKARLERNCDCKPLKSRLTPRITCDLFVDPFLMSLNETQYGNIVNWFYEFNRFATAQPYLKWRPTHPVHEHAKEWWQFAARPTLEMVRRRKSRCNRDFLLARAKNNVLYVKAYTEHLINPVTCPPDLREHKGWMEQEVDFKELKILRELAMNRVADIEAEAQRCKDRQVTNRSGAGLLQRWFPLWTGWYSPAEVKTDVPVNESVNDLGPGHVLEDELLDVLNDSVEETDSLFCRDFVFARINFTLKSGVFALASGAIPEPLLNLEITSVSIGVELRPRAGSTLFDLSLGAMYLRDAMTTGTLFPSIAAPQGQRENIIRVSSGSLTSSLMSRVFPWVSTANADTVSTVDSADQPLFHLIYEVRPLRSKADYKLHVRSRSLDVVYNASVFRRVLDFFGTPHQLAAPALNSSAQRSRLGEELAAVANKVKQQTKEELLRNWDQMLKGQQSFGKRWDVQLDVSTPQIIIPESFFDEDTTLVIFNFGRLQFSTECPQPARQAEAVSPSSSAVDFNDEDEEVFRTPFSTPPGEREEEETVRSPLTSPPVSSSPVEDLTETSLQRRMYDRYSLHLRDLQILVTKAKSNWKYAYLQGTSASHVVNRFSINIQLERRVVHTNDPKWPRAKVSGDLPSLVINVDEQKIEALRGCWSVVTSASIQPSSSRRPTTSSTLLSSLDEEFEDLEGINNDALLLAMEFQIGQLSLAVQSAGRSLAELQVTSIKSSLNKRPMDTCLCFTVQGLLLVDALQTFGPDFELLVASHKNICLDSRSGSMRDSEPTSPNSPASPSSHGGGGGGAININAAIKRLEKSQRKRSGVCSPLLWPLTPVQTSDSEALIVVEYTLVKTPTETTRLISVQFNSLDLIANQETITELASFFHRYLPQVSPVRQPMWNTVVSHVKLSFEFYRLSILLMKLQPSADDSMARKVATVTLNDASIQASLDDYLEIRGSLGGIQMVDLAHDRSKHSKIISVGRDQFEKKQQSLVERLQADLYSSSSASSDPEAFYFILTDRDNVCNLQLRLASVRYTHSAVFLTDLAACVTEFHAYASQVGDSLKIAATEVALGMVGALNGEHPAPHNTWATPTLFSSRTFRVEMVIESPILTVPESIRSDHVLEAHLGRITVKNLGVEDEEGLHERVLVEVRDVSLYSKHLESDRHSWPIVHNTALELNVDLYRERVPVHLDIFGTIVTPLKVSLSKRQYRQVLRTSSLMTFGLNRSSSEPAPKVESDFETIWSVKASFKLPNLSLDLISSDETSQGLVRLTFSRFGVDYVEYPGEAVTIDVTLDSVNMEDLLVPADDFKHRFLMVSSSPRPSRRPHKYLSSSCPDMTTPHVFLTSPNSLPDKLDTENVFRNVRRLKEKMMYGGNIHFRQYSLLSVDECPFTPPPSPLNHSPVHSSDALVLLRIRLIEDESRNVERVSDVHFNCLDMVVKYQPWKVVFDFFGDDDDYSTVPRKPPHVALEEETTRKQPCPTRTNIHVRRLSLLFTNDDYELANVSISNLTTDIVRHPEGNLEVDGTLARISLVDLTPEASQYRERFTTYGDEALVFHLFKYAGQDPDLKRDFDVDLRLSMSTVRYVHTNRFYVQITTFLEQLFRSEQTYEQIKVIKVDEDWLRSLRCRLNVQIESPAIVLPVALWSQDVVIARLGHIRIDNQFILDQTSSGVCLLDVIHIKLSETELCIGSRADSQHFPTKGGPPLLTETFHLELEMKRNLDSELVKSVPGIDIEGAVSAVRGTLHAQQYQIIRGILEHNLGEQVADISRQRRRSGVSSEGWTQMMLKLKLVDVTLDFVDNGALAKVNFINSELIYRTTSNGSSEVDLVSREILISDTRFNTYPANNRPNVFCNILQATRGPRSQFKVGAKCEVEDGERQFLQAELHYRANRDIRRLTVLLNHMRVIAIFDWWTEVLKFISASVPTPDESVKSVPLDSLLYVASGVVTRHGSGEASGPRLPFDLKINITETGIVVIEDAAVWDTNAVILETTAIVNYCPSSDDKPLGCTVQRLEVFSCILGLEEDTALSIVDPVINADVVMRKRYSSSTGGGLQELTAILDDEPTMEVGISELSVRLSYHDLRSFVRILDSLPNQLKAVAGDAASASAAPEEQLSEVTAEDLLLASKIAKLEVMGFSHGDCFRALTGCSLDVGEAALWLTQNATVQTGSVKALQPTAPSSPDTPMQFKVHVGQLSVCLIDDCKDADVPLMEFHLKDFLVEQKSLRGEDGKATRGGVSGNARGQLDCDYYNRSLSGWEPFVEPFGFKAEWRKEFPMVDKQPTAQVSVAVDDLVDVNVTSTLVDLYRNVKTNWTEDYYRQNLRVVNSDAVNYRRRSPFVPFALKNSTGCKLSFSTTTINPDQLVQMDYDNAKVLTSTSDCWTSVEMDHVVPFTFEGRLRMRHRNTREPRIHQLMVRVDGWQQVAAVSVDKVGVFFRDAKPAVIGKLTDTARIVFEVSVEGSAQKLITVRSALVLHNRTETTVEVRLDGSRTLLPISSVVLHLKPNDKFPVPLPHVNSLVYCRPYDVASSFLYCCSPIRWQHITQPNDTQEDVYACSSMGAQVQRSREHCFRFCARVHRDNYPLDSPSFPVNFVRPAHTITLLPPVVLCNLLPFELTYRVTDVRGVIPPGKSNSVHHINVSESFRLDFEFETSSFQTFKLAHEFEVDHGCSSFAVILEVKDNQNRSLLLQAKGVALHGGSSLEISIGAEYWIINRTGLPLIFKQEGVANESAGQSSDNEKARSVAPLLFSFADREAPSLCSVRIGRIVHPTGEPRWCRHFNLQKGVQFRRLYVLSRSQRPDWVYSIGIDVRVGPAKYGDVYIVTLTPRFQLANHSSHRLEFCQKYALESGQQLADVRLSAMPNSFLPFHWPRLDQEQLLCARISDTKGCTWSGGFHIERIDSFHICMRDDQAKPAFLRVEVVLLGATYTVVFTNADNLPPPYLLQNFCEVPIICYQTQTTEERLRITVRPNTTVPYAWDEPTREPTLTCVAPGGSFASYNLNMFGECQQQLSYENFIYIAFTETFSESKDLRFSRYGSNEIGGEELVLTVPSGTGSPRVILQRKVKGERSQLWRMTGEGMIQHEGSSPPRNSRKLGSSSTNSNHVLDIAEIALQPDKYVALTLRKPNPQRRSTQTWEFSTDGRLRCRHHNVYVQCADGYQGLRAGSAVVIGPLQPVVYATTANGIPVEQAISRHRLYPGSGLVSFRVVPEGPTRVLQILDFAKKAGSLTVEKKTDNGGESNVASTNWQVKVWLPVGLGISIVSRSSEELLYARFRNIMLEYIQSKAEQCFNGSVQDFQVDNQLFDAECTVLLYVTANSGMEEMRNFHPSISFVGSWTNNNRRHLNVAIFKGFQLQVKNVTLMIEEGWLYKMLRFVGYCGVERWDDFEDGSHESQGFFKAASVALAKRYYFGNLKLMLEQVRLSVITSSQLSPDLKHIKAAAGLTLVQFEDALVELDPFVRSHSCETVHFLLDSIWEHYREELKGQAAKILGAVDFLGNPIGLVNDLSEGLSELLTEGNVGGLLKNVTHGISNSAAKMTGTLSDGLSLVTMDERHLESRRRIQSSHGGSGGEHMVAGFKGLGFGLYSGITSIVTQTYEGASSEGLSGFFTGLGKGLVGTFTKPAAGVLDLASSAASAVRDTSKSKNRKSPDRSRTRRLCVGPGGLLPRYSAEQSRGLDILYQLNNKDYSEILVAIEGLNYSTDGLFALITSTKVYFLSMDSRNSSKECVLTTPLKDLYHCKYIQEKRPNKVMYYLELTIKANQSSSSSSTEALYKPRVLCDTEAIALRVSQQVNYAKGLYEEMVHTLTD